MPRHICIRDLQSDNTICMPTWHTKYCLSWSWHSSGCRQMKNYLNKIISAGSKFSEGKNIRVQCREWLEVGVRGQVWLSGQVIPLEHLREWERACHEEYLAKEYSRQRVQEEQQIEVRVRLRFSSNRMWLSFSKQREACEGRFRWGKQGPDPVGPQRPWKGVCVSF